MGSSEAKTIFPALGIPQLSTVFCIRSRAHWPFQVITSVVVQLENLPGGLYRIVGEGQEARNIVAIL